MTIKTQIKKEILALEQYEVRHRSAFERAGALVLTATTMLSMTGLGHAGPSHHANGAGLISALALHGSGEKNETVRMPIKFDDGLRATATTGS